jgi:hypothetical protein
MEPEGSHIQNHWTGPYPKSTESSPSLHNLFLFGYMLIFFSHLYLFPQVVFTLEIFQLMCCADFPVRLAWCIFCSQHSLLLSLFLVPNILISTLFFKCDIFNTFCQQLIHYQFSDNYILPPNKLVNPLNIKFNHSAGDHAEGGLFGECLESSEESVPFKHHALKRHCSPNCALKWS